MLATLADRLKYIKNEKALYKKAIQKVKEIAWTNMCKKESNHFGKKENFLSVIIKIKTFILFPMQMCLNLSQGLLFSKFI